MFYFGCHQGRKHIGRMCPWLNERTEMRNLRVYNNVEKNKTKINDVIYTSAVRLILIKVRSNEKARIVGLSIYHTSEKCFSRALIG